MSIVSYALNGNLSKFNKKLKDISVKENISINKLRFNFLNTQYFEFHKFFVLNKDYPLI